MKTIMQPVMQIFKLLTDAIGQTVEGLFNVRGLLKSMWSQFNSMTEVFINRFQGTLTALRATYMKLHSAIGKMFGVAVAGIMSGLSAYQATLSVFDLVINIIITILIIIAAIFIWLPFLFIAVLALIIIVVQMIERFIMILILRVQIQIPLTVVEIPEKIEKVFTQWPIVVAQLLEQLVLILS